MPAEEKIEVKPEGGEAEDVTTKKDGGVKKRILREGHGTEKPCEGDTVLVHYVGTLASDGSQFDSSRDRNDAFSFKIGKGEVIKGWDTGVATMKRGELAVLTCRGDYAYGEKGSLPKIPGDATLNFEVELIDFFGEDISPDKDKSIMRRVLIKGEDYQTPNDCAQIRCHLIGRFKDTGKVFDTREVEFEIGDGENHNIVPGIESALQKMKKHEKCQVDIQAKHAFGSAGCPALGVGPDQDVIYEIVLNSFEKAKENWQMNGKEKLVQSELAKSKGTEFFKQEKWARAIKHYQRCFEMLQHEEYEDEEEKKKSKATILAARLNLAACYLKTNNDFLKVVDHCDEALKLDDKSEKALFRRGQARLAMNDFELAATDFEKILELQPDNKAARQQLHIAQQRVKAYREREKRLYGKMFAGMRSSEDMGDYKANGTKAAAANGSDAGGEAAATTESTTEAEVSA